MGMIITFTLLFLFSCWLTCKKDISHGVVVGYGCMRICYLVFAPIVGMAIYRCLNTNSDSLDKVYDLESVANCMDDQTTLNTNQIVSDLND